MAVTMRLVLAAVLASASAAAPAAAAKVIDGASWRSDETVAADDARVWLGDDVRDALDAPVAALFEARPPVLPRRVVTALSAPWSVRPSVAVAAVLPQAPKTSPPRG